MTQMSSASKEGATVSPGCPATDPPARARQAQAAQQIEGAAAHHVAHGNIALTL